MIQVLSVGAAVAFAALSVFGITEARAQSAIGCPSTDPTASDCLQIFNPDGSQASLLAITESDELADPNRIWSIGGVVGTDPALTDTWVFELTEPGTGAISDVVGVISTTGGGTAIAFMSDAENGSTVFPPGPFTTTLTETSSPVDVSILMDAADRAAGFKVFFQSDLDATVPEPTTWAMMLLGFAGLAYAGWRRSVKARPFARLA
jgi:hypothetical protein